jgi:hypothetical protein
VRVKKLVLLFLTSLCFAQTPVTITGTITDFSNNIATSGYVQFEIQPSNQSLNFSIPSQNVVVAATSRCNISSSGAPVSSSNPANPCVVWPNDLIVPGNTLYNVTLAPNNKVTRKYIGVLISSGTNPQSLSTLTFVSPQGQVVGTVVNGNPLVTMSVIPAANNVWTLGDPQHKFAAIYVNGINSQQQEFVQSVTLTGCVSTCTFIFPHVFSAIHACVCSPEGGGTCIVSSKSNNSCILTVTASVNDVIVTGLF